MPLKTISAVPKKKPAGAVLKAALSQSLDFVRVCGTIADKRELGIDLSGALYFVLPVTPLSINSRLHWRTENAIKLQYKAAFEELAARGRLPPVPAAPWPRATIEATIHCKRAIDHDNSLSRCKMAIDLIVRGGWILDDAPKILKWRAMPEQIVDGKSAAYLVLVLREVDAPEAFGARSFGIQEEKL